MTVKPPPFSLFTAYYFLIRDAEFRFHLLYQLGEFLFALLFGMGVYIPCDTLAVHGWGINALIYSHETRHFDFFTNLQNYIEKMIFL